MISEASYNFGVLCELVGTLNFPKVAPGTNGPLLDLSSGDADLLRECLGAILSL